MAKDTTKAMDDVTTAVATWENNYSTYIQTMITNTDNLISRMQEMLRLWSGVEDIDIPTTGTSEGTNSTSQTPSSLDTGGYTGAWNSSDGRLALLHEKELVLNKEDTANMLKIVETVKRTGAVISGPIPLPTEKNVYTILRSPHVNKDSREQVEMRTHKRLIDIIEPSQKTIDALTHLDLPAGVDIEIKL